MSRPPVSGSPEDVEMTKRRLSHDKVRGRRRALSERIRTMPRTGLNDVLKNRVIREKLARDVMAGGRKKNTYTVRRGDNLTRIARSYGISLNQLLELNPSYKRSKGGNPDLIKVGAKLRVPPKKRVNRQRQAKKRVNLKKLYTPSKEGGEGVNTYTPPPPKGKTYASKEEK